MTKGEWVYQDGVLLIHVLKTSADGTYIVYEPNNEKWQVYLWSDGIAPMWQESCSTLEQAMNKARSFTWPT